MSDYRRIIPTLRSRPSLPQTKHDFLLKPCPGRYDLNWACKVSRISKSAHAKQDTKLLHHITSWATYDTLLHRNLTQRTEIHRFEDRDNSFPYLNILYSIFSAEMFHVFHTLRTIVASIMNRIRKETITIFSIGYRNLYPEILKITVHNSSVKTIKKYLIES